MSLRYYIPKNLWTIQQQIFPLAEAITQYFCGPQNYCTVLPTLDPMDYPLTDYSKNRIEVRCVVGAGASAVSLTSIACSWRNEIYYAAA